jgi:hypothetical protein
MWNRYAIRREARTAARDVFALLEKRPDAASADRVALSAEALNGQGPRTDDATVGSRRDDLRRLLVGAPTPVL